jgi:F0F1-type ATP synthase assembly protein I
VNNVKPTNVVSLVRQVRGCSDQTDAMQIAVDYIGGCTVNGVKIGFLIGFVVGAACGAIALLVWVST